MVLEVSTTDPVDGAPLPAAIAEIIAIGIDVTNRAMSIAVSVWRSAADKAAGESPFRTDAYFWQGDGTEEVRDGDGALVMPARPAFEAAFPTEARNDLWSAAYGLLTTSVLAFLGARDV